MDACSTRSADILLNDDRFVSAVPSAALQSDHRPDGRPEGRDLISALTVPRW
jgi:hypothetical protein